LGGSYRKREEKNMKKSKYTYFFELDESYVGYSWLGDNYIDFPLKNKERVDMLLEDPYTAICEGDLDIVEKLREKRFLINNSFDEFYYLLNLREFDCYKKDILSLTIIPTMACNCRCFYCYESSDKTTINDEVVANIKNLLITRKPKMRRLYVSWFGGEPLLKKDVIEELASFFKDFSEKNNIEYSSRITSNSTLLDRKTSLLLTKSGINKVNATLEGSRATHDKIRVFKGDGRTATYDLIIDNLIGYLRTDPKNTVTIRIHLHTLENNETEKIVEELNEIGEDLREKIYVYFRSLYSPSSHTLEEGCVANAESEIQNEANRMLLELVRKGFKYGDVMLERTSTMVSCVGELDNYYVIRPDGFINKCSVALEKERSIGKLTTNGIKFIMDRFLNFHFKQIANPLLEICNDCSLFPYCRGGCVLARYMKGDYQNCLLDKREKLEGIVSGHKMKYLSSLCPGKEKGRDYL